MWYHRGITRKGHRARKGQTEMKRGTLYVNALGCSVVHTMRIHARFYIDPAKLEAEIKERARHSPKSRYNAVNCRVEYAEGGHPNRYDITFAHLDAEEAIVAIVGEIEADIAHAQEFARLLDMTKTDVGDA